MVTVYVSGVAGAPTSCLSTVTVRLHTTSVASAVAMHLVAHRQRSGAVVDPMVRDSPAGTTAVPPAQLTSTSVASLLVMVNQ